MSYLKLKPLLAIAITLFTPLVSAELTTNRTIVNNNLSTEKLEVSARIPAGVTGDLYIAAKVNNNLLFLTDNGHGIQFNTTVAPFKADATTGTIPVLSLPSSAIPNGRFPFYQVVVQSATNPLDFNNWIGGPNGLSQIQIVSGFATAINDDFNNDGFADDDANHDGFHDDDQNKDGFHDDDSNHDGFHDSDFNQNGILTDDSAARGQILYRNCVGCHGTDPRQNISRILNGRDPVRIRSAINRNVGGMSFLSPLTDNDLNDIASYLQQF